MIYVKVALGMMSLNQSPLLNGVPAYALIKIPKIF
jgi:hypothetical protein